MSDITDAVLDCESENHGPHRSHADICHFGNFTPCAVPRIIAALRQARADIDEREQQRLAYARQVAGATDVLRAERDAAIQKYLAVHPALTMAPVCGNTALDPVSEDAIRADRAAQGFSADGGCGRQLNWLHTYRCLECGRWMHAECLLQHFAAHGDQLASVKAERDAERERRRLNVRRAWGWRRAAYWSEGWDRELARLKRAITELTAERAAALQRAERLLAGLRSIAETPDADSPAYRHCTVCNRYTVVPRSRLSAWQAAGGWGHTSGCWLAALIREAEGA